VIRRAVNSSPGVRSTFICGN